MNLSHWVIRLRTSLVLALLAVGSSSFFSPIGLMPRSLLGLGAGGAIAQTNPPCLPPESDEHLVLVNQQTPQALEQLKAVLPTGSTSAICQYLDSTVIRVGGFASEEVATAWGNYLAQTLDVQTAIVRPATPFTGAADTTGTPPTGTTPPPVVESTADSAVPPYNPQRLGRGYAVLVDYADRPDVAIALQSALGKSVGVAVYQQVPYLLAAYSADVQGAGAILTQLATANFNAILVESSQVILMTPAVADNP